MAFQEDRLLCHPKVIMYREDLHFPQGDLGTIFNSLHGDFTISLLYVPLETAVRVASEEAEMREIYKILYPGSEAGAECQTSKGTSFMFP